MKSEINSYTGFQPLKEVWLGGTYPEHFYDHLDSESQDIFCKITELTNLDLAKFEKKLHELNVIVRRPEFDKIDNYLDDHGSLIKPPITPRDWAITLADTLYVTPQYPSAVEPFGSAINDYVKNNQKVRILDRSTDDIDFFKWVTFPSVVRIGQDLYIDCPNDNSNASRYNKLVIQDLSKNYRVHVTNTGDHADGVFCPVAPGHIFSTHYRKKYSDTFPDWEIFFLSDTTVRREKNGHNGNWWLPGNDYPTATNDKLLSFAKNWVGNSRETVFEVNMLVIDEKNICCIAEDDSACKKLESLGITPHVIDFKTRGFWDGGLHCLTLDIHRLGAKIDYWPQRGPCGIHYY